MTNFSSLVIPVLGAEACAIVVMGGFPVLVVVWMPPAFPEARAVDCIVWPIALADEGHAFD
jgi:hypothetical protein